MNYGIVEAGEADRRWHRASMGGENLVTFYIQVDDRSSRARHGREARSKTAMPAMDVRRWPDDRTVHGPKGNTIGLVKGM